MIPRNNVKFYTKPILGFLLNFLSFPFVVVILSLFLDEILMPQDSPPIMHDCFSPLYARCFLPVFLFLILSCPKCALVWGNCCERLCVEIFVRVLRSSRVNFNNANNTNVFSVSESKVLLFCYCCGSQFCVTKAVLQVQSLVVLLIVTKIVVAVSIVGVCCELNRCKSCKR